VPKTLTMIIFITGESGDYGKIPANG